MERRESAARQALRKKRARKRAVRTAVFLALAAALGAAAAFVILPQMNGEAADHAHADGKTDRDRDTRHD